MYTVILQLYIYDNYGVVSCLCFCISLASISLAVSQDCFCFCNIQCESKKSPLRFSDIFPKWLGIFRPNFTGFDNDGHKP